MSVIMIIGVQLDYARSTCERRVRQVTRVAQSKSAIVIAAVQSAGLSTSVVGVSSLLFMRTLL